jgi:surfeit locus 1 family protein
MVRPRWLAALVLALVVAAGFAALGQWQLGRAIASGKVVTPPVEKVLPLDKVATVGGPPTTAGIGQLVRTTGRFAPDDYGIIDGRLNNGSTTGYWVTAEFTPDTPDAKGNTALLAVARGWAATEQQARRAVSELASQPAETVTLTGRLVPSEAPSTPSAGADPFLSNAMSVAALVNTWHGVGDADVYSSYLVAHGTPPAGLTAIYSPPPSEQATVDWLNVFYAAEWALFAGFAIFLWYRVVRDNWEKKREDDETDYEAALAAWQASEGAVAGAPGAALRGSGVADRDALRGSRVAPGDALRDSRVAPGDAPSDPTTSPEVD